MTTKVIQLMMHFTKLAIVTAAGMVFTPEDVFWGNLAGSMEAIDAGTTATLDHAHLNWSEDHSTYFDGNFLRNSNTSIGKSAIAGSITSGIRSIFAYTPVLTLKETQPHIKFASELMPNWVMEALERLSTSKSLTSSDSRVQLGFGFDFYFLPQQIVQGIFAKVKSLGVKIITSHFVRQFDHGEGLVSKLKSYGLLDRGIVLSHAGVATAEDAKLLHDANVYVSATPNTELAMAVGPPVPFRQDLPLMDEICSLGIDCHSATSGSLVNEMRFALQVARGHDSAANLKDGQIPRKIYHTTADVFNMGTIQGARALCLEHEIGSVKEGKKADLVVFDALSPAMIGVAQQDPVSAIVLHSSIGDVNTVIVDGRVRKRDGKLLPVRAAEWRGEEIDDNGSEITWADVCKQVLGTQKKFVDNMAKLNIEGIEASLRQMYGKP